MKIFLPALLCLALAGTPALAASDTKAAAKPAISKAAAAKTAEKAARTKVDKYSFDPLHTQVGFSVDHLGFSHPSGRFTKFTGGFGFDQKHPEKSWIDVTIDPASLSLDSAEWESAVKGADFLNTAKFHKIIFKSTKIEKTAKDKGAITGDLTLLGVTHPVTLDVTYNKSGVNPYNRKYVAGFSATASVSRSDFGMTFGLPGIGDTVAISLQVEGLRKDAPTAAEQKAAEKTAPKKAADKTAKTSDGK